MVERDCLQLGEPLATVSVAQEDWELVVDEFAAALGEDRRTTGEACALLLAAAGRRAAHAAAFWQHVAKDRGAAAAERVANQDRQRIERSEVIQWGEVSAGRQVGGENQTRPASEPAQQAAMPLNHSHGDLGLTGEGGRRMVSRRDKVEIGNSGQRRDEKRIQLAVG